MNVDKNVIGTVLAESNAVVHQAGLIKKLTDLVVQLMNENDALIKQNQDFSAHKLIADENIRNLRNECTKLTDDLNKKNCLTKDIDLLCKIFLRSPFDCQATRILDVKESSCENGFTEIVTGNINGGETGWKYKIVISECCLDGIISPGVSIMEPDRTVETHNSQSPKVQSQ